MTKMSSTDESHQYLSGIAETLFQFQQNGILCDIVIQIQGLEITAHSVILAAASPSLRELLPPRNPDSDPRKPVIQLEGYDSGVARLWLEFVYTGRCTDQPKSAKQFSDMLSLCEALQMPKPDWDLSCLSFTDLRFLREEAKSHGVENVDSSGAAGILNCGIVDTEEYQCKVSGLESESELTKLRCSLSVKQEVDAPVEASNAKLIEQATMLTSVAAKVEDSGFSLGKLSTKDRTAQKRGKLQDSFSRTSSLKTVEIPSNTGVNSREVQQESFEFPRLISPILLNTSTAMGSNSNSNSYNSVTVAVHSFSQDSGENSLYKGNTLKCKSCGSTRFIDIRKDKAGETQSFPVSYKCLECGEQILTLNGLELERQQRKITQKVSQRNIHVCELCGRAFGTHSGLFGHLAKHPLQMLYETTCRICKSSFTNVNEFLNHVVIFGGSNRNQRSAGSSSLKLYDGNVEISGNVKNLLGRGRTGKMKAVKSEASDSGQVKLDIKMGSHKCPVCLEVFWTHASLYRHRSQHEFFNITDESVPMCGICQTAFANIAELLEHIKLKSGHAVLSKDDSKATQVIKTETVDTATTQKVFECSYCGRSFGNKGGLQSHVNMHLDGRPHKCPSCGDSFRFSKHLSSHARMYHNVLICSKCGLDCSCSLEEAKALETAGEKQKARLKRFSCLECQKTFCTRKGLLNHRLVHDSSKNFICEICGLGFRRPDRLASHKFLHVSKPYPCKFCHKCFLSAVRLEEHTRTHTGESPLVCSHCGQHFKARGALRVHLVRKHSTLHQLKVVTNKCNLCGRQFSSKAYLMLHVKWHSGKFYAYRCQVCNRGFYDAYALRKHMVVHAELRERPFLCYTCGKGFTTRGNLKTHAASHKNEKLFFCSYCSKGFKFKSNLNKHLKVHVKSVSKLENFAKADDDLEYTCEEIVPNTD